MLKKYARKEKQQVIKVNNSNIFLKRKGTFNEIPPWDGGLTWKNVFINLREPAGGSG
jgi:hypothetical protein